MLHYTDDIGFKAIASQLAWTFRAFEPRGPHPQGAYFTVLIPTTPHLAKKLRLPKRKLEWLFEFSGEKGLLALDDGKGRGQYIFFCPADYVVEPARQLFKNKTDLYPLETQP